MFDAGKAHMSATNLALFDFFNIPNALFRFMSPASVPATCGFDIRWSRPVTSPGPVTSPSGSTGELVLCKANMTWTASNALGFKFQSNPANTTSAFAQLGHVSNGVFAGSA